MNTILLHALPNHEMAGGGYSGIKSPRRLLLTILRSLVSIGAIMAVIHAAHDFVPVYNSTIALTLLLAVLGIAAVWGSVEAIVASLVAGLEFNYYFLPPYGLGIDDPQDWVVLLTFLTTAIIGSQLSLTARRRAQEATERRREIEKLHDLQSAIMIWENVDAAFRQVPVRVAQTFGFHEIAFYRKSSGQTWRSPPSGSAISEDELAQVASQGEIRLDEHAGLAILPVRTAQETFGSLGFCGVLPGETLLKSIADLVAGSLVRIKAIEEAGRAEAARRSEELKATVFDSLAHDIKTPLTSIKAAVTCLLPGDSRARVQVHDLLSVINEETDRLDLMVSEAIDMARTQAGILVLENGPHDVQETIYSALKEAASSIVGRTVHVRVPVVMPSVDIDPRRIRQVINLLVDNAVKYSPAGSPVTISAQEVDETIVLGVSDMGPGIMEDEQERIFEMFYRSTGSRERVPGTGMGLAIAKRIIDAHGGKIWVTSRPGAGSTFHFSVPLFRPDIL